MREFLHDAAGRLLGFEVIDAGVRTVHTMYISRRGQLEKDGQMSKLSGRDVFDMISTDLECELSDAQRERVAELVMQSAARAAEQGLTDEQTAETRRLVSAVLSAPA